MEIQSIVLTKVQGQLSEVDSTFMRLPFQKLSMEWIPFHQISSQCKFQMRTLSVILQPPSSIPSQIRNTILTKTKYPFQSTCTSSRKILLLKGTFFYPSPNSPRKESFQIEILSDNVHLILTVGRFILGSRKTNVRIYSSPIPINHLLTRVLSQGFLSKQRILQHPPFQSRIKLPWKIFPFPWTLKAK